MLQLHSHLLHHSYLGYSGFCWLLFGFPPIYCCPSHADCCLSCLQSLCHDQHWCYFHFCFCFLLFSCYQCPSCCWWLLATVATPPSITFPIYVCCSCHCCCQCTIVVHGCCCHIPTHYSNWCLVMSCSWLLLPSLMLWLQLLLLLIGILSLLGLLGSKDNICNCTYASNIHSMESGVRE